MIQGIDLSAHNGIVNMQKVKEAGYGMVFLRAGYGKNNIDQKYLVNAQACRQLSLPVGIYWFSYGYSEAMAKAEGEYAATAAGKFWERCPIAFDLEYDTVAYARKKGVEINKALASQMAVAFFAKVIAGGHIPVLYTNKDYKNNYFDLPQIQSHFTEKIYLWYARYVPRLNRDERAFVDLWQKSSTGRVAGIGGKVDINEIYTDFGELRPKTAARPTANLNILHFQKAANQEGHQYEKGMLLVEDGIDGIKTQYVRRQVVLQAKKADTAYRTGSTGRLVRWWQKRLCEMGFVTATDGSFGADTRKKTVAFQKKYQLTADGIAGYHSLGRMFDV